MSNNSKIIFVSIGANKRLSKYLISRKMDIFFGKLKFTNDFGTELAPSLTHNCKSYRHFMGQALLCILDFPGSLYYRSLLSSDNNSVI